MLKISNLTKKFGKLKAVDKINLTVKKGEVVGFLGPNGAGKTTTMRLITNFLTPTRGKIRIDGKTPAKAKKLIGYLPEENPLYPQFTVKEYLTFVGQMHRLDKDLLKKRRSYVIKACGIKNVINRVIDNLSRGYKQRVGLAATLIHDPQLLLMDEPTTGLDPNQQTEIRNLIKDIAKDKAVIFSTHILSEAETICEKVIIINKGKIVAKENIKDLRKKKASLEKLFTDLTN